jgi:hypothetical protein
MGMAGWQLTCFVAASCVMMVKISVVYMSVKACSNLHVKRSLAAAALASKRCS